MPDAPTKCSSISCRLSSQCPLPFFAHTLGNLAPLLCRRPLNIKQDARRTHSSPSRLLSLTSSNPHVVIAGAGPVGLFLALSILHSATLTASTISSPDGPRPPAIHVTLLETSLRLSHSETKAMAHQPALFPEFERLGLMPALFAAGAAIVAPPVFRDGRSKEVIAKVPGPKGALILGQGAFVDVMARKVQELGGVIKFGRTVVEYHEDEDRSEVIVTARVSQNATTVSSATTTDTAGDEILQEAYRAAYLVAADGAHSTVRRLALDPLPGITLPDQLIATDVRYSFDKHGFSDANFLVHPEHYGLIGRIDMHGLWRVSFGAPMDTVKDEIDELVRKRYEAMFPGPRPLQFEVVRVAPYKAQQRCVETMGKGRVLLVGDAAHSKYISDESLRRSRLGAGFLDASSLGPVLLAVLQRGEKETLLSEWATERRRVFLDVVDPLSRAALRTCQDGDTSTLAKRSGMIKAMQSGKMPPPPAIKTDITKLASWDDAKEGVDERSDAFLRRCRPSRPHSGKKIVTVVSVLDAEAVLLHRGTDHSLMRTGFDYAQIRNYTTLSSSATSDRRAYC
ncbi:hypothetical protein MRB53_041772 [Persea americana]|nr:hypothetical protein MRB53_041772 [Persea americana]